MSRRRWGSGGRRRAAAEAPIECALVALKKPSLPHPYMNAGRRKAREVRT